MKKLLFSSLLAALTLAACSSAPDSDEAEVGEAKDVKEVSDEATKLAVNTDESQIEWVGTKTTGRHHGTIQIEGGSLAVKDDKIVGGEFTIDMNTIKVLDEDLPEDKKKKLRGHLMSGDFFKVEEFPTAKFEITNVETTNETVSENDDPKQEAISEYKVTNPTHKITGNLTMRDSTKSISFPAKVTMTNGKVEGTAKFNINRKDWGLKWEYPPGEVVLNNTIHLGIKLHASGNEMASTK